MPNTGSVNQMRAVRLHHHVVRRVQPPALERSASTVIAAVVFRAGDAAAVMLAGDQPALAVARVAVGIVGGLAEDADRAGLLVPAQDAVVGDVAPQHSGHRRTTPGLPTSGTRCRAARPRLSEAVAIELWLQGANGGIRIARFRLPHGGGSFCLGGGMVAQVLRQGQGLRRPRASLAIWICRTN